MSRILLVGCGKMGEALASGWLEQGRDPDTIMVVEPNQNFTRDLISKGVKFYKTADALPFDNPPKVVIFAVKPQVMDEVVPVYTRFVGTSVFISIAAGKTIGYFEKILGVDAAIVRVMPNTPAAVHRGISGAIGNTNVSTDQRNHCSLLIEAVSELHWLDDESHIDIVTAISGSGPAYVFYFMQSMLEAALKMGFSPNDSKVLVSQTFEGAVKLFNESDLTPEKWMDRVASKGGTTRAALDSMEDNNVKELIKEAAYAAFDRATELGKEK